MSLYKASIVIITTAAGKIQDNAHGDLDPAITLWLVYAFISVVVSGSLLFSATFFPTLLPAARLSQVRPKRLKNEIDRLERMIAGSDEDVHETETWVEREKGLKMPLNGVTIGRIMLLGSGVVILLGWILFGLGVGWGVHGRLIFLLVFGLANISV